MDNDFNDWRACFVFSNFLLAAIAEELLLSSFTDSCLSGSAFFLFFLVWRPIVLPLLTSGLEKAILKIFQQQCKTFFAI